MSDPILESLPDLLAEFAPAYWGIADISGLHPLSADYPRAISLLFPYAPSFGAYSEEAYHHLLEARSARTIAAVSAVSALLAASGVRHYCVPQGGQDPYTLLAEFPHKLAAVRAGLGWIGKSTLLVTSHSGPRVQLATILLDCALPCGVPVEESSCGDCMICAQGCPYACIRGMNWRPGISRNELFDAHLCSAKRESFRSAIGHKHECGLCLLACPFGHGTGRVDIEKSL